MFDAYEGYLAQKAVVQEKYAPFYVRWVRMGHSFLKKRESATFSREEKERFLNHLSKTFEPWQVDQADAAIRIYDYFLSSQKKNGAPSASPEVAPVWASMEAKMREVLRVRRLAYSTEKTYILWLRAFRKFIGNKDPRTIESSDMQRFLSYQAVEKRVAASTQNQALNALVFFFRNVLDITLGKNEVRAVRARQKRRLPVVLSPDEIQAVFEELAGTHRLMAMLIYGCGLRLQECLRLRIKDLDLEQNTLIVRSGKGDKDRRTVLPESLNDALGAHDGSKTRCEPQRISERGDRGFPFGKSNSVRFPSQGRLSKE